VSWVSRRWALPSAAITQTCHFPYERDPLAVRRPGRLAVVRVAAGQFSQATAVDVDHVDLAVAVARRLENAILRPSGDQAGAASALGFWVRFCCSLPSTLMTMMS